MSSVECILFDFCPKRKVRSTDCTTGIACDLLTERKKIIL